MKIYDESSSSMAVSPGRKVSFAGPTSNSGRTPLQASHNHQSNNNNNNNNNTPMQSFRRSLKDKKQTPGKTTNTSLTPPGERTHMDKENQPTPNSAPSFRRTLRGQPTTTTTTTTTTIGQRAGLGRRFGGTSLGLGLGPPQRVAPKTPNSLLRTELDTSNDSYLEQSMLVSPPGALWNVLGANHTANSASSTSLVIVSPQAAASLHEHWSSQKKPQQQQSQSSESETTKNSPLSSPPLQPRSLPVLSPEVELSTEQQRRASLKKEMRSSIERAEQSVSPVLHPLPVEPCANEESVEQVMPRQDTKAVVGEDSSTSTTPKSVAMDLSSMFSDSKTKQSLGSKISPPPHLLKRLQKREKSKPAAAKTHSREKNPLVTKSVSGARAAKPMTTTTKSVSRANLAPNQSTNKTTKVKSPEAKPKVVAPQKRTNGVSMNFSPPQKVSETKLMAEAARKGVNGVSMIFSPPREVLLETSKPKVVGPRKGTNGVSMDLSGMFSDGQQQSIAQATPPPHLLKRLQQGTRSGKRKEVCGEETKTTLSKDIKMKSINKSRTVSKKPSAKAPTQSKGQPRAEKPHLQKTALQKSPIRLKSPKAVGTSTSKKDMDFSGLFSDSTNKKQCSAPVMPVPKKLTKSTIQSTPRLAKMRSGVRSPKSTPATSAVSRTACSPHKPSRSADDWAGKQCDTFASWLKYTFHPTEDEDHDGSHSGLRAVLVHRRLSQVRFRAAELFHGDSMRAARNIVHAEISRGRLSIRPDRDVYADLSLRKQAVSLLLSYTTPWLRLGLEVMFGESIMPDALPEDASAASGQMTQVGRLRAALKTFIVNRVLSDASVLAKYTKGKCKVPSGKFEKLYRGEMRTLVLYRLVVLVLFLDRAKTENVLDKVPRLFSKGSAVKSSRAVLLAFCRDFLSSEGDFIKHLSRIGLTVSYKQDPVDELDFNIANLATDLRDGVKLTRMTEIVSQAPVKSLMATLRLPAVSRLQKLHNVNIALVKLKDFGILVPEDLNAHHVVDCHREMVLKLMWSVIAHSCMTKLLEGGQVEAEIDSVIRSNQSRRKIQGLMARAPENEMIQKHAADASPEEILKSLLFHWCQAVCSSFGLPLSDFTTSFADGKTLCILVHYYHPAAIRLDEILPTSNDDSAELSPEQAMENERANSSMAAKRVSELGGIPNMLPVSDTTNPPNEKSMLLCLSYLCSRLMESSKEIFATILIQACYRKYRSRVLLEKKKAAAWIIYQLWLEHKDKYYAAQQRRYAAAVAILEDFVIVHKHSLVRMKRDRLERERQQFAASEIQRCFRGSRGRAQFLEVCDREHASITIQTYFRRMNAQNDFFTRLLERDSAMCIQRIWRGFVCRDEFVCAVHSTIDLQRVARGLMVRCEVKRQQHAASTIQQAWWDWVDYADMQLAATIIQNHWRAVSARKQYAKRILERNSACAIQRVWRGYCQSTTYAITVEFIISIQRVTRGFLIRKELPIRRCRDAATNIQKAWRGFSAQVQFQLDILDIISIQSLARRNIALKDCARRVHSVMVLQGGIRCALARRALIERCENRETQRRRKQAAIVCQCAIRGWISRRELTRRKTICKAARTIQSHWRKVVDRSAFVNKIVATILIQNFHRGVAVRREIQHQNRAARLIQRKWRLHTSSLLQNDAATELQRHWRANICRKKFHLAMASSISVQKVWRRFAARDHYARCRFAATVIQTIWRSHSARLNYELDVLEIVIAQSVVRRYVSHKLVVRRWHAIQVIQNAARRQKAVGHLEMLRRMRTEYHELARATILAQSFVRRLIAQNHRQRKLEAIVVMQTWWRAHNSHQIYCKLKSGVKAMQASFRGGRERQQQSSHHRNATVIQCQWRCFSSNVKYNLAHADIVTAQSMVRRHLAARFVAEKRRSILLLQAVIRRWKARRLVHDLLVQLATEWLESSASTVIQSLYRGHSIRKQQNSLNRHATVIQCRWRFFSSYAKYNLARADIVTAQSIVRRHLAARFATEKRRSILLFQAVTRRWKARCRVHDLRVQLATEWLESSASTVIQSLYRGHSTRQQQNSLNRKATIIQCQWRFFSSYAKYNLVRADIVTAQSIVRRQLAARFAAEKKWSILLLQAVVRRWKARCRVHDLRVQLAKEWLASSASTVIQSLYRGHSTRLGQRLKHAEAAVLQAAFRGYIARLCFDMDRMDVTISQSCVRRWLATRSLDKKKNCVLKIQKASRLWIACHRVNLIRMQQKREWIDNSAALMVQSVYRGHVIRRSIETQHEKAIVVQSAFRGHCMRLWYEMYLVDLTIIQSVVRRWLVNRKLMNQQQSVVVIQTLFRRRIATQATSVLRSTKLHLDMQSLASVAIQRLWRAYVSRLSSGEHAAARKIQKTWRCFDAHVNFLYQVMSILTVQTLVRRCLARRSYQRTVRGFVKMQALARGNFERRELRLASLSAIIIQSAFRAKYERTIFEQRKHAAITIQRWARGYFCRVDLDIASFAASEIQRVWRGYSQFVDFALLVISAIKVQTYFRMRLSMKAYREKKLASWAERAFGNKKALLIQRAFRLHAYRQKLERAARTMQISVRAYIHRKRIGMVKRGTARLQAVFRARLVRRRRPKKVYVLAGRIVRANTRAKEDPKLRLGYRTSRALHILQTSASLAEIMDAVKSLETSTRLSIVCCVLFTEAKATHILLELMRSCNRSVPHVELVQCILLTLDNVAQHRALAPSFADCNSAEVFLDKMQLFRDKDGIFCLSISLLNSIAACNPVVEEFCGMHEHLKRLNALHQISLRRERPQPANRRDTKKRHNRMHKREFFDRHKAIKVLGELIKSFETHSLLVVTPTGERQHFTF